LVYVHSIVDLRLHMYVGNLAEDLAELSDKWMLGLLYGSWISYEVRSMRC